MHSSLFTWPFDLIDLIDSLAEQVSNRVCFAARTRGISSFAMRPKDRKLIAAAFLVGWTYHEFRKPFLNRTWYSR